MQSLTDNALMIKVKNDNLDMLGLLYERHRSKLFGFFFNLGNNRSVSEDMVQNVCVRILKYRKSFTGEGPFTAWMFRMARNVHYDHHKKASKMKISNGTLLENVQNRGEDCLNQQMEQTGNAILLRKALGMLPNDKREILILSKYRELRFSEIAQIVGCTEGAAKVRVHRALKDLRSIFLQLETV